MPHLYSALELFLPFLAFLWVLSASYSHFVRLCRILLNGSILWWILDINDFAQALESVFSGKATILNRMRLALSFYDAEGRRKGKKGDGEHDISVPHSRTTPHYMDIDYQVLNEIALHRGASPHLNMIDVYVDNQFLTEAVVR